MGNLIKLTESDLIDIVKKVISEQQPQTAAFTAGQNLGKGVKKGVQAVGQGIKNVTLQTVQIGKSVLKGYVVGTIMVFMLAGKAFKLSLSTINNYKNYQAPEPTV